MRLSLGGFGALIAVGFALLSEAVAPPAVAQEKLRFGVGPFQPTPTDTRKAYDPFLMTPVATVLAGQ